MWEEACSCSVVFLSRYQDSPLRPQAPHQGSQSPWRLWTAAPRWCRPCCPAPGSLHRRTPGWAGAPWGPAPHSWRRSPIQRNKEKKHDKGHFPMQWRSKSFISLRLRGASYRRVFCEPHFLSTQRQNIHQLFTCSFLQRARGNGNIVSKTRMSQFNFTETTQHFYPKSN